MGRTTRGAARRALVRRVGLNGRTPRNHKNEQGRAPQGKDGWLGRSNGCRGRYGGDFAGSACPCPASTGRPDAAPPAPTRVALTGRFEPVTDRPTAPRPSRRCSRPRGRPRASPCVGEVAMAPRRSHRTVAIRKAPPSGRSSDHPRSAGARTNPASPRVGSIVESAMRGVVVGWKATPAHEVSRHRPTRCLDTGPRGGSTPAHEVACGGLARQRAGVLGM